MELPARRSLVVFALLAAGIVVARSLGELPAPAFFSLACLGCAIGAVARGWTWRVSMALACVAFAGGWWTLQVTTRGGSTLDLALDAHRPGHVRRIVEIEGVVASTPRRIERGGALARFIPEDERYTFEMRVDRVHTDAGWRQSEGRVLVLGDRFGVVAGERVSVLGLHTPTRGAMNPGLGDRLEWSAQRRDAGMVRVPGGELVSERSPTGMSLGGLWLAGRAWLGDRARAVLDRGDSDGATLLRAVTLGVHDPDRSEVREAFTRVGLAHLMAISGFHLALLAGLVLLGLRLSGDWGRGEAVVLVVLVLGFLIVVPARPPIVRAGLVLLALVFSEACGRRYDRLSVLGWVGVLLLLWRPMDLFTLGFQLSLGLTGALLWLAGRVDARLRQEPIRGLIERPERRFWPLALRGVGKRLRSMFVVSLVCWMVALPVVMHHTGLVSPMAIVSTLLVTPMIVGVLVLGFSGVVVGLLVPGAGRMIAGAGEWMAEVTVGLVGGIDALPMASFRLPMVSVAWAICGVLLAIGWLWLGKRRWRLMVGLSIGAMLWLGIEVRQARLDDGVALRLDTLSVGDGTCHLLRSGDEAMLWDCGSARSAFGQRELARIVRALGSWRVKTILITHPNLDHDNAILDAIGPLGVETVILGEAFMRRAAGFADGPEAFILAELGRRAVGVRTVAAGDLIELGGATIELVSPGRGWDPPSMNDASLVGLVRVATDGGERRVLLTGDIERGAMGLLLDSDGVIAADVLELPHHGSHHAIAERFVGRVDPGIVVQSTGPGRLLDERWERARIGRDWLVTASDGAISVRIRRDGTIERKTVSGRGSHAWRR